MLVEVGNQLRPGIDLQFFVNLLQVGFNGMCADEKPLSNLIPAQPIMDQTADFHFAPGEPRLFNHPIRFGERVGGGMNAQDP